MSARRLSALLPFVVAGLAIVPRAAWSAAAPFRPPPPVVRTLANGLTVAVFEDDRLPMVQIQLLIPAGAAEEQAGESGIANLTFQMLGHGTASRSAADYDNAVDALGGTVGGAVSREFATVNGTFLSRDLEGGLELLADAVVNPLFSEGAVQAIKAQAANGVFNARQNPGTLADDHLWAAVFHGHPYGAPTLGAPRVMGSLGIGQVQAFHRLHYRPDRALLALAGDVTSERAFKAAEELLGSWGGRAKEAPPVSLPTPEPKLRIRIVDAPQLSRAELRLGAVAPGRANADYDPLTLAGEMLGSAGEPGLRVVVSGLRMGGLMSFGWSAPVDSVAQSIGRVRSLITQASGQPASAGDLEAARRRLIGGFTLQFDTRGGLIAQWMAATLYRQAGDRMADYPQRIAALDAATVRDALARHVTFDHMVLVVVGPAEHLRAQLAPLGAVETVPAEAAVDVIQTPSTTQGAPTPAQMMRGRTLVDQMFAAHGGLERLRGIKDSTLEGEIIMSAGGREVSGRIVQVRKDPDRFRFETTFTVLKSLQVLDGSKGWARPGDPPAPVEDLDSVSVAGLRSGFRSDPLHLMLSAAASGTRVAWRGQERRDDRDVDVVELVAADGERRLLFLDVTSHRLVAMEQSDVGRSVRRIYRDLRDVKGVLWPFYEERLLDGHRAVTVTLSRVALNTGVSDAQFAKPGTPGSRPAPGSRAR